MAEDKKISRMPHNIILEDRAKLSISGISDVDSYDEQKIIAFTNMGVLTIQGTNLHISQLSVQTGELLVEGEFHSLTYSDEEPKGGASLLSRLFK